jgi:hypothetical protein
MQISTKKVLMFCKNLVACKFFERINIVKRNRKSTWKDIGKLTCTQ